MKNLKISLEKPENKEFIDYIKTIDIKEEFTYPSVCIIINILIYILKEMKWLKQI